MCNLHVVGHMFAWLHISLFLTGNNFMELHKREWRSLSRPSPYQAFLYPTLSSLHWTDLICFKKKDPTFTFMRFFFVYFFGGLDCVGHSFAYVPLFMFFSQMSGFEPRELPEQAGALPTQPPTQLIAIHFCLSFSGTWKDHNVSFPVDRYFYFGTSVDRTFFFETQTDPRIFLF